VNDSLNRVFLAAPLPFQAESWNCIISESDRKRFIVHLVFCLLSKHTLRVSE